MKNKSNWLVFTLVAIAQFMVTLDISITNVALPTIKHDLHFTNSSLQWVITAYALTFGGFLLLGGRAADLFGRRRTLLTGMAAFTLFSLLIGLSRSSTELMVLRACQGAAAALMSPSALSIVITTFRDGAERNRALAYWSLVASGGAAVGLLLGGVLTQYLGWKWDFFVNVPIGIIMSFAIYNIVPKHEPGEATHRSLNLPGAVMVTSSLILQVLAFSEAPSWGWLSMSTLGLVAISVLLMGGFIFNEARLAKHPLMPLSILTIRNVVGANIMMAAMYATMLGQFFILTIYIQDILGYSPVKTGLAFIPFPLVLGFMATRIPKLVARFGYKRFLIVGPLIVSLALVWLSRLPVHGSYLANLLPTFIIMPLGLGVTFMPIFAAATSGVPAKEAGLASGLITTSQQMGGALGLAILASIAASITASSSNLGAIGALVHGFDRAVLVSAGFMLFAVIVAVTVIRKPKPATSQ
jgi:EmrB/QacA subfamily drug resistance transporter